MPRAPFSIFRYSSYREYFQDAYQYLHEQDPRFSYELIAVLSALKSRTQVRNFMKGLQRPTAAQLKRLAECFDLLPEEMEYALALLQFEEMQGSSVAMDLFQKLLKLQKKHAPDLDPFKEFQVASSVLHMTLLTYLSISEGRLVPQALHAQLKARYTIEQIENAIQDLVSQGYLVADPHRPSYYLSCQKHIKTYDLNPNYFLRAYHQECLQIAEQSLHSDSTEGRYLVGASVAIQAKVYPRVIQKLNAFLESLMQLEGVGGKPDLVIQLSTQVVKMTQTPEEIPAEIPADINVPALEVQP